MRSVRDNPEAYERGELWWQQVRNDPPPHNEQQREIDRLEGELTRSGGIDAETFADALANNQEFYDRYESGAPMDAEDY